MCEMVFEVVCGCVRGSDGVCVCVCVKERV